jgi:hypothetical protein
MTGPDCEIDKQMGEILNQKRSEAGLFGNLWIHDIANRMKIRRQVEAKAMGLGDDYPVGTYPSHGGMIVNNVGGFWKGAALAGLTSVGLGAGMMALSNVTAPEVDKKTPSSAGALFDIEILGTDEGVKIEKVIAVP